MDRKIIATAAFFGMTAVILGALGAHALKKVITIDQLISFETGVKYQMYHALFLLFLGLNSTLSNKLKKSIYLLLVIGILMFSGSIYLLSTMDVTNVNFKPLGIITPIGGVLLISAWALLLIEAVKKKS
jgi:uncharacterized membrane protein YgdD (TMEM256/DUF423 family)